MKKQGFKFTRFFLLFLAVVSVFTSVVFSGWIYGSGVSNDFSSIPQNPTPVAYIDRNGVKEEFYTIEKALYTAASGETVIVYPTKKDKKLESIMVNYSCEVKAGVSLNLPADDAGGIKILDSNQSVTTAFVHPDTYCKTSITLAEGVTLINNGTINIGGVISGGGGNMEPSGQTSSYYGRILMNRNSKIVSRGVINCYGYIEESELNNDSEVLVEKGDLTAPFIVYEHRGGSSYMALYLDGGSAFSHHFRISPFNRFSMPNVTSRVVVNYGAKVFGHADLFAQSKHNEATIQVVGTSPECLIQLKPGSQLINKTKLGNYVKTSNHEYVDFFTNLDFYGSFALNAMKMDVVSVTVSTNTVFFPITYLYNIHLHPAKDGSEAIVNVNQDIKIMTGSNLTIDRNVTVNASKISIYETFNDIQVNAFSSYPKQTPITITEGGKLITIREAVGPGNLTVNGKLVANQISGKIIAGTNGAQLTINNADPFNQLEIKSITGGKGGIGATVEYQSVPTTAIGPIGDYYEKLPDGQITNVDNKPLTKGVYIANNRRWGSADGLYSYTIKFDMNAPQDEVEQLPEYIFYDINDTVTLQTIPVSEPLRQGFDFAGWYLDSDCNQPFAGHVMNHNTNNSITLYAKWTTHQYKISYYFTYEGVAEGTATHNNPATLSKDNLPYTLEDAYESNPDAQFYGWVDSSTQKRITVLTELRDYILVGAFIKKVPSVKIDYKTNNPSAAADYGLTLSENIALTSAGKVIIPAEIETQIIEDIKHEFFISGYYYLDDTGKEVEYTPDSVFNDGQLIYARWQHKKSVTYKYRDQSNSVLEDIKYYTLETTTPINMDLPQTEYPTFDHFEYQQGSEIKTMANDLTASNQLGINDLVLIGRYIYKMTAYTHRYETTIKIFINGKQLDGCPFLGDYGINDLSYVDSTPLKFTCNEGGRESSEITVIIDGIESTIGTLKKNDNNSWFTVKMWANNIIIHSY